MLAQLDRTPAAGAKLSILEAAFSNLRILDPRTGVVLMRVSEPFGSEGVRVDETKAQIFDDFIGSKSETTVLEVPLYLLIFLFADFTFSVPLFSDR